MWSVLRRFGDADADADGGGGPSSSDNPFTSHEMSKAPMSTAVPLISPEIEGGRGKGGARVMGDSDECSGIIETRQPECLSREGDDLQFRGNDNGADGKGQQNVTTMSKERQLNTIGMVSPEQDGVARSPSATAVEKSATASALTVATITPLASTKPATVAAAQSAGSTSSAHKAAATVFQTPRKSTPEASDHAKNTEHKTGITPHLAALSADIPSPYSPLTPATRSILETSPFKSSMQVLDERLQSVLKLEGRLDSRIEGARERMWEGDDSFDSGKENACFGRVDSVARLDTSAETEEGNGGCSTSRYSGRKSLNYLSTEKQAGRPDDTLNGSLSSSNELRRVLWSDTPRNKSSASDDLDCNDALMSPKLSLIEQNERVHPLASPAHGERKSSAFVGGVLRRMEGSGKKGQRQNATPDSSAQRPQPDQDIDTAALQRQLAQSMTARGQLWEIVSDLRAQLKDATRARDASAEEAAGYKNEAKALESELQTALGSAKERDEEAEGLRKCLEKRDVACEDLQSTLKLKENEIRELNSISERREKELASVQRQRHEEGQTHLEAIEKVQAELESTRTSHAEQLGQAQASHDEEAERVRQEAESSLAIALENRVRELSASHAEELERQRCEAEKQREEAIERVRKESDASSVLALDERVRELSALHTAALEEQRVALETTHRAELDRLRHEMKNEEPTTSADEPPSIDDSEGRQPTSQVDDTLSSDDFSFYVGDAEEGFRTSESVHASDISETASESEIGDYTGPESFGESLSVIDESAVEEETMEVGPEMLSGLNLEESAPNLPTSDVASVQQEANKSSLSATECELAAARAQCDVLSAEVEGLMKSLAEAATEREDLLTSLTDARQKTMAVEKQLGVARAERDDSASHVSELEDKLGAQLASRDGASQDLKEAIKSRDHFQGLAAKLAINVIQLKMQCKMARSELQQLDCSSSQCGTPCVTTAEKDVSLETTERGATELDSMDSSPSIPEEKLQWMVAKLATALVKMKGREVNLSKEKAALNEEILDLKRASGDAQKELEAASKEKAELNCSMKELSHEKKKLQNEVLALGDKVGELEAKLQSTHEGTREIEDSVSAKDDEIQRLHANLMTKTGVVLDLKQQNNQLSSDMAAVHSQLYSTEAERKEARARLQTEIDAASKAKAELEQAEEAMLELHADKVSLSNHLAAVLQEKSHVSAEIDSLHDTVASLEVEKESLSAMLQECQAKTQRLGNRVVALESQVTENDKLIFGIESQLASKVDEAEGLLKTVNSHEATLCALRLEMASLREEKAGVEGTLSSLHGRLDRVMGERDGLASQLDNAMKELESLRAERNNLAATVSSPIGRFAEHDAELEGNPNGERFVTPLRGIREILSATSISEEDVDRVCDKMSKAQIIIGQIERERKLLKKEVKHLRADLQKARDELAAAKDDNKTISRQAVKLRTVVSQARTVIEKAEDEKKRLASDLDNAQHAMKRIKTDSSNSYRAIVSQNQEEIIKLRTELRQKNDLLLSMSMEQQSQSTGVLDGVASPPPNEISRFDVSSATIAAANYRTPRNQAPKPPVVSSKERFKIEKGSMFGGVLKSTKKSGRKGAKYRHVEG
ncbi:hypothetical protein ACHAXT_012569 [Thalassiosira profunda]